MEYYKVHLNNNNDIDVMRASVWLAFFGGLF